MVLERADAPGGKLREVAAGGARIDAGPTVFTMRSVFEEMFAACGESLDDASDAAAARAAGPPRLGRRATGWTCSPMPSARPTPSGRSPAPAEAAGYRAFCARARRIYGTLEQRFIRAQRPSLLSLCSTTGRAACST